jgi:Cu/Ag efflux pump CusA
MMYRVIATSLRFRFLVLALAAATLVLGAAHLRHAKVDVLPEFTPPYVEIQTEALGLSPAEVEQLITVPLEADLLNGVQGVDVIRSKSVAGMSSIVMVFNPETDLYRARALVQERLTQAHALPQVSRPPTMLPPLSSSSRLLMIGLSSDKLTPIEQSVIARWTVRPRLMGVPGVANVALWGQRERQLQVQVDPERLRARGVTLGQVVSTAGNAQIVSPLSFLEASTPGTGGFIETGQQRLQVRHVFDKLATPKDLGAVPVDGTDGRLRLSDVATVAEDHQPLIGDAIVHDRGAGLFLVVEKFPGADARRVTRDVEDALQKLRPGLGGMRVDTQVFRPASYIEDAIDHLTVALIAGGILLALAVAAWFAAWRPVLVTLVAVPLSLVTAALVLDLRGQTIDAIAFAGLAAAIAVVVSDAVSSAAGVAGRMRRDQVADGAVPVEGAVLGAFARTRGPLVYATLIAALAAVPVLAMEGRPGAFFEPLGVSYLLAVAASMAVALTVTPALSLLLLARAPVNRVSPALRRLAPRYDVAVRRAAGRPRGALGAAAIALVLVVAAVPLMGTSLIPAFKDRDVVVRLDAPPGTSQPAMTRIVTDASRAVRTLPGVEDVGGHVGRAVTGDQVVDVNSGELWVSVDRDADYAKTMASIQRAAGAMRGVKHDVVTSSEQRLRDVGALTQGENAITSRHLDVLTGADDPLVVRVFGEDLGVMRRKADEIRRVMAGVDGVVHPRVQLPATQRNVEIEVDLAKARRLDIKPGDVRRAEAMLLQGIQVGSIFEGQKVFEVVVQGTAATRRGVGSIRNLLIDTPGGRHVRLGQVADVRVTPSPTVIERDSVSRRLDVVAGVSGRGLGAVADDVKRRVAAVPMPLEYHAEVLQKSTGEEINIVRIIGFTAAAVIAAFLLLQAALRSWRLAVVAFLTVPAALLGGVAAAALADRQLSLGALLGLVALLGITVHNSLALLRLMQDLERDEAGSFAADALIRAARERLAPVLIAATALAALAAPVAVMGSIPGLEIVQPMAIVLLGGLVTTTLLALFVVPPLALRFGQPRQVAQADGRPPLRSVPPKPESEPEPEPEPSPA